MASQLDVLAYVSESDMYGTLNEASSSLSNASAFCYPGHAGT